MPRNTATHAALIGLAALAISLTGTAGTAAAKPVSPQPGTGQTAPADRSPGQTARVYGTFDTGNELQDQWCEGQADIANSQSADGRDGSSVETANRANQRGCKLFILSE
ncbi:hypothetical protein ACFVKB_33540 [Rhodococcus sp. NPDC127530]|uniref:hypothetical protein n=1 Tax=unclassified Rhodococcus (in: high G+C Gram-positive bacteria) TaxID=192944 RepID=UPI003624C165